MISVVPLWLLHRMQYLSITDHAKTMSICNNDKLDGEFLLLVFDSLPLRDMDWIWQKQSSA